MLTPHRGAFGVLILTAFTLTATMAAAGAPSFDHAFEAATLRLDVHHGGDAANDMIILDRAIRQEGWAGSTTALVDTFPQGTYRVVVREAENGQVLFTRGFDSVFGEYRTTAPARQGEQRMFHESVLVPFPRRTVRIAFERRQPDQPAVLLATFVVDPDSFDVSLQPPPDDVVVLVVHDPGRPASEVVDLTFVGEGYTAAEAAKFATDLERFGNLLLEHEPFASQRDRIAIRGVLRAAADSGCDEPRRRRYRSTPVEASFNALGSERYLLVGDNRALRDLAGRAPTDAIVVMVNHHRYGGGGIYNQYCTFTTDNEWSGYLLLHELGHSFAGLGDEYYTSSVAYEDLLPPGIEPDAPNVTALGDPTLLKWRDLVSPDTPLPTPWRKQVYDELDVAAQERRRELEDRVAAAVRRGAPAAEIAALEEQATRHARAHARHTGDLLAADPAHGVVGAFEGAGYQTTGLYRPTLDCIMFSRGVKPYCPVCQRAVTQMVDFVTATAESAQGTPQRQPRF